MHGKQILGVLAITILNLPSQILQRLRQAMSFATQPISIKSCSMVDPNRSKLRIVIKMLID